jgi:hypothetical protein
LPCPSKQFPAVSIQPSAACLKLVQRKTHHIYSLAKKTENYSEDVLIAEPYFTGLE